MRVSLLYIALSEAVISSALLSVACPHQPASRAVPSTQSIIVQFQNDLEAARSKHDFAALQALDERIETTLWPENHRAYFDLAARVASSASSYPYDERKASAFATKVADLALRRADAELSLNAKVTLVMLSQHDLYGSDSPYFILPKDQWLKFRRDEATRWLSLHDELVKAAQALPSPSDPSNWPDSNVSPPSKTPLVFVPGTPASQIADPQARAEYEASIDANDQKVRKMLQATIIAQLQLRYASSMRKYLIALYSLPGSDWSELARSMEEHGLSADERGKVMAKLHIVNGNCLPSPEKD